MAKSKIEICNIALGLLGSAAIRDFNEDNKRARMCELFFDFTRDELLAKLDWTFARCIVKLQNVVTDLPVPAGWQVCQLPSDCVAPRSIEPQGTQVRWEVFGDKLRTNLVGSVYLRYTKLETDVSVYTPIFCNLLALGLAVKLCMPVAQDKRLFESLTNMYRTMEFDTLEADANIGTMYREYDNDPNNDTFVSSGGNYIHSPGTSAWQSTD